MSCERGRGRAVIREKREKETEKEREREREREREYRVGMVVGVERAWGAWVNTPTYTD